MAKSSTLSEYLGGMVEKIVLDAIAQVLAQKQHEHDAAIKKLEGELRVMTQRATAAEIRIAAVNAALGLTPRRAGAADLRAVSEEQDQAATDNAPGATSSEPVVPKAQPSVVGIHLSDEQKRLRSEVIRQFHERRKKTGVAVTTLAAELGVAEASCYDLYYRWCKDTGVPRAKPARGPRSRNSQ